MGKNDESASSSCRSDEKKQEAATKLRIIKERFGRRLDENVYGGVQDRQIKHGLAASTSTILHKCFTDMCFCEQTQEYLVLDRAAEVHRYSLQGKLLRPSFPLEASTSFSRMLWCGRCLVGYEPEDELIWLLSSSCELLQPVVKNDFRTRAVHYEAADNLIVVVGTDQTTTYCLEDQAKELEASKAMLQTDPAFGPTWQIECSSLVPRTSSYPASRLAASYFTTLYLLALHEAEDDDEPGGGAGDEDDDERSLILARRANASPAAVTALHWYQPTQWLISGDQQGNVMAHNIRLECTMSQPAAHQARVSMLAPHPSICGFLSNAADKLQVWSCNFRCELEAFEDLGGTLLAHALDPAAASIVTLATRKLSYLTMRQLYCYFAPLTAGAKFVDSNFNPMYPTMTVVVSQDNSARLFSSGGTQLTVQMLPEQGLDVSLAVYSGNERRLFTIMSKSGEILASDASTEPMKFKSVFVSNEERITSIACYESFDEIRNEDGSPKSAKVFYPMGIRIFAGTDEGKIITLNSVTGKHESVRSAHCGSVIQLRSSSVTHRLVSLGMDKCVKVWRILADLAEPLHLFFKIRFIEPVAQVAMMGCILCAVNSSKSSSLHHLVMYNMKERDRLEHRSTDDHCAQIVDMITSEPLTMCATSSLDNTIRIWNHDNCLVNILRINICAWNIAFSSTKGDIVFGAGRHLYKIPYENYLTPYYRAKICTGDLFGDENEESPFESVEYRIYDEQVDKNRMLHPVSSLPLGSLDTSNSDSPQVDLLIQKQLCDLIQSRDEDIRKIEDYLVAPTKVIANRALMTTHVWDQYVNELLKALTPAPPEVPDYDFQTIVQTNSAERKTYNELGLLKMLFGQSFDNFEDTQYTKEMLANTKLPLHGFLPNSLLYKHKPTNVLGAIQEQTKKYLPKYIYPAEFYKGSRDSIVEKRESIRLSQLMIVQENDGNQETT